MQFPRLIFSVAVLALCQPALLQAQDDAGPATNPLIVGGEPVPDIADTPWQVALVSGGAARNQFCGGSLVAETWVLTAAHCVDNFAVDMNPARLEVVAGTLEYASGGEQIGVTEILVHPNWNDDTMDHDAALLRLASPATLGQPIELMAGDDGGAGRGQRAGQRLGRDLRRGTGIGRAAFRRGSGRVDRRVQRPGEL